MVQEEKTHKIIWDFVLRMDHPIPARDEQTSC